MADHRDTLLYPFENGHLVFPQKGQNWVLLNADVLPAGADEFADVLRCEQGFRPQYLALEEAGYDVEPVCEFAEKLDGCWVLASRSRRVNEKNLARAWNATKPGGLVVFAGDKKSGIASIRKWFSAQVGLGGSLSKNHAVVFWAIRDGEDWPVPDTQSQHDGYSVSAGMFSAGGPDKGSQLLAEQFDNRIFGRVADFGAGWGYLSSQVLQRSPRVEQIEMFEADRASLDAAIENTGGENTGGGNTGGSAIGHWCDLTREAPRGPFNWIIMNPPFHTGRAAEPELGATFIKAAARALPAGGRLLMVANTNLPYERVLEGLFKKVERRAQANGFKVIEAVKGSR